jgi:hypothetical protein
MVLPKLPVDRHRRIVRVTGDYFFDLDEEVGDYGHVLPVEELVADVASTNQLVSARLVRTMRTRSRLWNTTQLGDDVDHLIEGASAGLERGDTELERLKDVMSDTLNAMRKHLAKRFCGNENESRVRRLLERLYGADAVRPTHGRSEHGADFETTTVDPLGVHIHHSGCS